MEIQKIRVDKELTQNIMGFEQVFTEDNPLLFSIFVHICELQFKSSNYLNYITIDPRVFASEFNYNQSSWFYKILPKEECEQYKKEPHLFDDDTIDRNRLFINRFENCLYKLKTINFPYTNFYRTDTISVSDVQNHQLLDDLMILIDHKRKGKKYYHVKLSDRIINNLYTFFHEANLDVYKSLKRKYKWFYLVLCNTKNSLSNNYVFKYKTEYLAQICGLLSYDDRNRRSQLKKHFDHVLKADPNLNLKFFFVKKTYEPVFALISNESVKEISNQEKDRLQVEQGKAFNDYIMRKLFGLYHKHYGKKYKKIGLINKFGKDMPELEASYKKWYENKSSTGMFAHIDEIKKIAEEASIRFNFKLKDDPETLRAQVENITNYLFKSY